MYHPLSDPRSRAFASPPWRAALAALLGVAIATTATAEPSDADVSPRIDAIRIEGSSAVSKSDIRARMVVTGPSWKPWVPDPELDEVLLRDDLERIAALYRERGYYEADVSYELQPRRGGRRVAILLQIEEGEPVRLYEFAIEMPPDAPFDARQREAFSDDLPLELGGVFGSAIYSEARRELLRRLAEQGHPAARLEGGAEVDLGRRAARVSWQLDPGPAVVFGEISVGGLERVDSELVTRELTFREGEPFSRAALEEGRKAVYDLDLFRTVVIESAPPEGDATAETWPVTVTVEERPPRSVRLGAGYGTEDGLRASARWVHRNFFGQARRLELTARYSSLVMGAGARLRQPRFLDPDLSLDANLSLFRETVPAYNANRIASAVLLTRPIAGPWSGRVGHSFEFGDVTDLKVEENVPTDSRLSTLELGLTRSTVENPFDARAGTWLDLSVAPSLGVLGSQVDSVQMVAELRAYQPLWRTVLALRLRGGTIAPFADSNRDDVPIFKRFFSGGSNSVRGFDYQHLGPLDAGGDPLGGLSLAEGSLELRFPIWRWFRGVAFGDAGQLSPAPFAWNRRVYFSVGPGLRVDTPIGLLRLDWGYILNPPEQLERWRIHFSVGQMF